MTIKEALKNREQSYHGIYHDVGKVLDNFKTEELINYYVKELKGENLLRNYLEQQITENEISMERYLAEAKYYDDFEM